ncbi:unnamed protein product [Gongylonema pulchrum]|uniref:G_PROTEIN_RECEP_F1_2 domain-containing protein n=1 Tax=Gongylonema pulchrum TaxID=637853 RepID=A0A3P7RRR6_9BILA|nr:unnamed protein product [Gongylonema pulchrum]
MIHFLFSAQVQCVVVAIYSGLAHQIWTLSAFLINLTTVTLYTILGVVIRKDGRISKIFKTSRGSNARLLRSLRVVAACVGLGWLMTMVVNLMTFIPDISDLAMFYTAAYAGIFVNVSIACNWFIYYFRR